VAWYKRGSKFTSRAVGKSSSRMNGAILEINNFQREDLGVYICRARPATNSSKQRYIIKGESHYYLMARDFGFETSEQTLYGPDVEIKVYCNQNENSCVNKAIRLGESVLLTCSVENFGKQKLHIFLIISSLSLNSISTLKRHKLS
jgi:hypothetical protein